MLILPDFTITARFAASVISASFSPVSPVVPITWTQPWRAACSAKVTVAAGTVKSRSPSARASSGSTSVATATPLLPSPASSPASRPITAEEAASTAPAMITPSVAATAWISVRPMRPPAPATISRMSDMELSPRKNATGIETQIRRKVTTCPHLKRWAGSRINLRRLGLTSFDNDEIELGFAFTQRGCGLIVGGTIAIERQRIAGKLKHHCARANLAFHHFLGAAAHEEARAKVSQRHHVGGHVHLAALGIADVGMHDPVAFAHRGRRRRLGRMGLLAVITLDDHEIAVECASRNGFARWYSAER